MRLSTRADLPYTVAGAGFPLSDVWQMIVPGALSHFSPLYVGLLPLALVVFAIGAYAVNRKVIRDRSAGTMCLSGGHRVDRIVISFGGNLAIFDGLYWFMPGYRVFRDQERDALIVSFALAVLTAYGADVLLLVSRAGCGRGCAARSVGWWRWRSCWRGIAGAGLSRRAKWIARVGQSGDTGGAATRFNRRSIGLTGLSTCATIWLAAMLIGVVALDLITINRAVNWVAPYDPFPTQPSLQAIQQCDFTAVFRLHNEQRLPGHAEQYVCGGVWWWRLVLRIY